MKTYKQGYSVQSVFYTLASGQGSLSDYHPLDLEKLIMGGVSSFAIDKAMDLKTDESDMWIKDIFNTWPDKAYIALPSLASTGRHHIIDEESLGAAFDKYFTETHKWSPLLWRGYELTNILKNRTIFSTEKIDKEKAAELLVTILKPVIDAAFNYMVDVEGSIKLGYKVTRVDHGKWRVDTVRDEAITEAIRSAGENPRDVRFKIQATPDRDRLIEIENLVNPYLMDHSDLVKFIVEMCEPSSDDLLDLIVWELERHYDQNKVDLAWLTDDTVDIFASSNAIEIIRAVFYDIINE